MRGRLLLTCLLLATAACQEQAPGGEEPATPASPEEPAAHEAPTPERVRSLQDLEAARPAAPAEADDTLCRLHGARGDLVACQVALSEDHGAAGVEISLAWPAEDAEVAGVDVAAAAASGHSAATRPPAPTAAAGSLTLMLYDASVPVGVLPAEPARVGFRLLRDLPEDAAVVVRVTDAVTTSPEAMSLPTDVKHGRVVVTPR